MSRIEEALRRASRSPDAVDEESPAAGDRVPAAAAALDRYVPEEALFPRVAPQAVAVAPELRSVPPPADAPAGRVRVRQAPSAPQGRAALDGGGKLVVDAEASPVSVEQYRRVAATLYQAQVEQGLKTIMVSSALPREGKTLTATNLALTLSESYGQRVVLVDADLRAPRIHDVFGVPNTPGLTDYLHSNGDELPTTQISPTLSVITAGYLKGNPIAGLVSDRMGSLLKDAAARFDWVVVDTPPVGLLPDANLLARLTDAVVFVVAAGATPYAMVQRAVAAIGPERIMGVVLNRAADSVMPHSTYYSHYSTQGAERQSGT